MVECVRSTRCYQQTVDCALNASEAHDSVCTCSTRVVDLRCSID